LQFRPWLPEKVVQRLCNFAPHLNEFVGFKSRTSRPFSFILNPKAGKCLHTFEIQNTANVVAMDETAIYDYSSVRICLNANIPTFLKTEGLKDVRDLKAKKSFKGRAKLQSR
jgi:hypothetical protein